MCRTRDLRSLMLVKVDHAIREKDKVAAQSLNAEEKQTDETRGALSDSEESLPPDKGLRLMNAAPPQPLNDSDDWHITDDPTNLKGFGSRSRMNRGSEDNPRVPSTDGHGLGSELEGESNQCPVLNILHPKPPKESNAPHVIASDHSKDEPSIFSGGMAASQNPFHQGQQPPEPAEVDPHFPAHDRSDQLTQPKGAGAVPLLLPPLKVGNEDQSAYMQEKVALLKHNISTMVVLCNTAMTGADGAGGGSEPEPAGAPAAIQHICQTCLRMDVMGTQQLQHVKDMLNSIYHLCYEHGNDRAGAVKRADESVELGSMLQAVGYLCRMAEGMMKKIELPTG